MKIAGIVTITNPDYRQDPARECIRQALEIVDEIFIVHGRQEDIFLFGPDEMRSLENRVHFIFLPWPQPEWTLDELPRHLNAGIAKAKELGFDWAIKFDADYFIHENEANTMRNMMQIRLDDGTMLLSLNKRQVTLPTLSRGKSSIPIVLRLKYPIWFGQNRDHYTDLCQPIIWDGISFITADGDTDHAVPVGIAVEESKIKKSGCHLWNYGYTFKTYDRAKELLYYFDLAHAAWWGKGWYQNEPETITSESAMDHHLRMSEGRLKAPSKALRIEEHPKHIQQKLRELTPEQFGHSLWGKIKMPV